MPAPTVFISYSHRDEVWKDRLLTHLRISEREGLLELWDDRRIAAGTGWRSEIEKAIDTAEIGVLLISADFLTSDFIRGEEIPRMLERRSKNGMRLFPVIVRSCDWQIVDWLEPIQIRPDGARPLASFRGDQRDAQMAGIAKEIRGILSSKQASLLALHQLPPPPADFTGREEDLAALRSALAQGGTGAIFGLRGTGGVGKTVLALKLAEELMPLYPDAQLYLDLKGVDSQPLTPAQAMGHVIRSRHPEARIPDTETELAPLYRSVLHGKRCLLLMDNAASHEQVEPLIPPPGSLLLVTSRFHFALPGLISRDLDEMSPADARDLLLRIAPRIDKEADEVARLCGRLPLALRLAGSALAERSDLRPTEYARRLREGKERLGLVEASLSLSYELLVEDRRRLWRRLSVFPGTFDAPAAAEVWELDIDPARDALGDLVRCSLVEWEEKEERYRLHDLARQFADRRLKAAEREAAKRRHAEYFLTLLGAAEDLYLQGGESVRVASRLFDTEWGNIQAGQAWAADRFLQDNTAARICDDYPNAATFLLELRQNPREWISWLEQALAAARQQKDRASEGYHLGNLGIACAVLGEPRRAIEFYEQRRAIARDIGDRRGEGQTLGNLGIAYAALGEPRRAIEFYEQHLAIAREVGDRQGEAIASWNLGDEIEKTGDLARAADLMQVLVDYRREIGHPDAERCAARVEALRARLAEQGS